MNHARQVAAVLLCLLATACGDSPPEPATPSSTPPPAYVAGRKPAGSGNGAVTTFTPALERVMQDRVLVIAHRGASRSAPENTLPAFKAAVTAGADLVELDYRNTADGVAVVIHDETLDRTTNSERLLNKQKVRVDTTTSDALKQLDAGRWFGLLFEGTPIPTLAQALDVIQDGSMTLIERKAGNARDLIELLRERGDLGRVVVQSFDWLFLLECRALASELTIVALGDRGDEHKLPRLRDLGAAAVGWRAKDLHAAIVKRMHAQGLDVWAYTVNDVDRAKALIEMGVDGIITDIPTVMIKALR